MDYWVIGPFIRGVLNAWIAWIAWIARSPAQKSGRNGYLLLDDDVPNLYFMAT